MFALAQGNAPATTRQESRSEDSRAATACMVTGVTSMHKRGSPMRRLKCAVFPVALAAIVGSSRAC